MRLVHKYTYDDGGSERSHAIFGAMAVNVTIENAAIGYVIKEEVEGLIPIHNWWRPTLASAKRKQARLIGGRIVEMDYVVDVG